MGKMCLRIQRQEPTKRSEGKLAQVTGSEVHIDLEIHYNDWADSYINELLDEYGYCTHEIGTKALAETQIPFDSPILDVGCGSGLAGLELSRFGYAVIDGLDMFAGMLEHARIQGVYRQFFQEKFLQTICQICPVTRASYALAVLASVIWSKRT